MGLRRTLVGQVINVPCGYDPHRRFQRRGGCGVWVGYEMKEPWWNRPLHPAEPHFRNGIAWCGVCVKGFQIRHLGQGVFVRPREEGDDAPLPNLPKLEELYG